MRQTRLPFARPGTRTFVDSSAIQLLDLQDDQLVLIGDRSMTTCTRLALTCKDMKRRMVKAASKGLRLSAPSPALAVRAERAGLFKVAELHLTVDDRTVSVWVAYCKVLTMLTTIVMPPDSKTAARRAGSLLSWKLRPRTIHVRARSRVSAVPWQVAASLFLTEWMRSGRSSFTPRYSYGPTEAEDDTILPAPFFNDDPLGDSTDGYFSEDDMFDTEEYTSEDDIVADLAAPM